LIVGFDGSDGSRHAVHWAAREATMRGDTLTLVTALHQMGSYVDIGVDGTVGTPLEHATIARAEAMLDAFVEQLSSEVPKVRRELLLGTPPVMLLDRGAGSSGLVVGRCGRGGFAGLMLGSVSQHVVVHATCPVVVVPATFAMNGRQHRAVVVGVDGSPHSRRALARASEEAWLRDARLDVVIVSPMVPADAVMEHVPTATARGDLWIQTPPLAGTELSRHLRSAHAREVVAWQTQVRRVVEDDLIRLAGTSRAPHARVHVIADMHPAEALLESAASADLLVVGSRGYGGFVGMLLGSVSHHCVRHASVPVLVVPSV
jgi:nucleotide-binding universal stress UspA family protein